MKISIRDIEKTHQKHQFPTFRVGDQVRATLRIVEGDSERLQAFEGTVIRISGIGLSRMFTLRKISFGVGVERAIPFNSPRLEKIEVIRSGHVRRARLYFLRERSGRAARLDEKADTAAASDAKAPAAPAASAPVAAPTPSR